MKTFPSKAVKDCEPKDLITTIQNCLILYYGIFHSNIPEILITESIKKILFKFPEISLHEIKHSFERLQLEKKVTVSISDVMDPIQKYYNVKYTLSKELEKLKKIQNVNDKRDQAAIEFVNRSIELYNQSLIELEWKGNMFNAFAIAKKYIAPYIDQKIKDQLWIEAKNEHKKIVEDEMSALLNLSITPLKLFSEKIVKKGIELCIEIKPENHDIQ